MDKKSYMLVARIEGREKDKFVLCNDGQFRFRAGWLDSRRSRSCKIYKSYVNACKMLYRLAPMTVRHGKPISFSIQEVYYVSE